MTSDDIDEAATRTFLARLPALAPDRRRGERTRQRCRARLQRDHRRREHAHMGIEALRPTLHRLAAAAFYAFCVVYVGALLATTFQLPGFPG